MLSKEKLIQTIRELPDSFSVDDLFERIILLQKIEIGMEQSKSGQVHTTQEAREKLKKWLLK
jgi:predicted transcriptional regulator